MRRLSAAGCALLFAVLAQSAVCARAVQPVAAESSLPVAAARCDAVSADVAGKLLGYPVGPPDATSRAAGICFYPTQAISENGLVSYAVVTTERLAQRRNYFTALTRVCAGVAKTAPRAAVCATYVKLAQARDLDEYFAARTSGDEAVPVAALGEAAYTASGTLYVRRAGAVFEVVVRRDRAFDAARSVTLANLLLAAIAPEP